MQHKTSTAYHSQTIGGCERNHRVLNEFLRMYVNDTRSDWDEWTRYFAFCYNTTPSTYHNYTPFELVFAKKADIPEMLNGSRVDPLYNIDAYDQEVRFRLQLAQKSAREYLEKAKRDRKVQADLRANKIDLAPGDLILVSNESRTKLDSWLTGPFSVIAVDGPNCTIRDNKGKHTTIHKNRVKKYVN